MQPTYDSIPRELLEENLKAAASAMPSGKWFAFFGTLLGLVRGGRLISGDDDIDIYVNVDDSQCVKEALENVGFLVSMDCRPDFIQLIRVIDGREIPLDVYFFKDDGDVIIEKWNFSGPPLDPKNMLKIPKHMIYPLKEIPLANVLIAVPTDPEGICAFLYGQDWRVPRQKLTGYRMEINDGVPSLRNPTFRERLSGWNKIHIRARTRNWRGYFDES
jgi:hypothetical protein